MKVSYLLAAVAILGLVGFAMAAKGDKKAPAGLHGKVVSIDTTAKTVTVKARDKEVVVATDATTVITLDGAASSLDKLTAGMIVTVTPATGTATKIVGKTPKK